MDIIRVTKDTDPYFPLFMEIYEQSFPIFEQRTSEQHLYALSSQNYHLDCYVEDGMFLGFVSYWAFGSYVYIEHLAIHPQTRGLNYGSRIMSGFMETHERIILEIDPIVDDISARRLRFYEALGFAKNTHRHFNVEYRKGFAPLQMLILSTNGCISKEEYQQFHTDLMQVVMGEDAGE